MLASMGIAHWYQRQKSEYIFFQWNRLYYCRDYWTVLSIYPLSTKLWRLPNRKIPPSFGVLSVQMKRVFLANFPSDSPNFSNVLWNAWYQNFLHPFHIKRTQVDLVFVVVRGSYYYCPFLSCHVNLVFALLSPYFHFRKHHFLQHCMVLIYYRLDKSKGYGKKRKLVKDLVSVDLSQQLGVLFWLVHRPGKQTKSFFSCHNTRNYRIVHQVKLKYFRSFAVVDNNNQHFFESHLEKQTQKQQTTITNIHDHNLQPNTTNHEPTQRGRRPWKNSEQELRMYQKMLRGTSSMQWRCQPQTKKNSPTGKFISITCVWTNQRSERDNIYNVLLATMNDDTINYLMGQRVCRHAFVLLFCSNTIIPALNIGVPPSINLEERNRQTQENRKVLWNDRPSRIHFHSFFKFIVDTFGMESSPIDASLWLPTSVGEDSIYENYQQDCDITNIQPYCDRQFSRLWNEHYPQIKCGRDKMRCCVCDSLENGLISSQGQERSTAIKSEDSSRFRCISTTISLFSEDRMQSRISSSSHGRWRREIWVAKNECHSQRTCLIGRGYPLPRCLYDNKLQATRVYLCTDNTVKETNNRYMVGYLQNLVEKKYVKDVIHVLFTLTSSILPVCVFCPVLPNSQ